MKKKKKNKFNINLEYKPKRTFEIKTTIKNVPSDYVITFPNISYIIIIEENKTKNVTSFSIFNLIKFDCIQKITSNILTHCFILDENQIILSGKNLSEIWNKEQTNKFNKNKSLNFSINSNILFYSKSLLFFHNYYDYMKSSIEIWETENKIPKSLIIQKDIISSYEKKLFFINNEKILVVYHYPFGSGHHFNKLSISFYDISEVKNIKNIKNLELDNIFCDLKPFKLDENRIIIIEKISADNSYDENIKKRIQIMKIPEFEIIKEIDAEFLVEDVVVYKNYFIFYEGIIKIYNSDNYEIFKEIDNQGIYSLVHLNDNYFFGIVKQYYNIVSNIIFNYYEEENQKRDIVLYEVNF